MLKWFPPLLGLLQASLELDSTTDIPGRESAQSVLLGREAEA